MTLFPSACMWPYKIPMTEALRQVKETSFHYIDIEPDTLDAPGALQAKNDLGLKVSCVVLDHKMPSGVTLDGKDRAATRKAIDYLKQALRKSESLGAKTAYVAPCAERKNLKPFGEALGVLAEDAAGKGIKLCVEHVPGRALPTAKDTLAFIEQVNHPNLFLLLDVGHTLLCKEKAWEVIAAAGKRLGYVQMNDNDGRRDRHWPLLEGRLTYAGLQKILGALKETGYEGTLGLELSFDRASLVSGFSRNRNLLIRIQEGSDHKSMQEPEARRKIHG